MAQKKAEPVNQEAQAPQSEVRPQAATKISDLKGIKVTRVMLHQAFDLPAAGTNNTFSESRQPGIKLCYTPSGVTWEYKNSRGIIPLANVIGAYE